MATPVDPVSGLPTGSTLPDNSGALPRDSMGRSIQAEQGVRHEDGTAGPIGTAGNIVSPVQIVSFTPLALVAPASATRLRIRTDKKLIYGLTPNFNLYEGPQGPSASAPQARATGTGHATIEDNDGWRELPIAGIQQIYFAPVAGACRLYFEFLVLSNL